MIIMIRPQVLDWRCAPLTYVVISYVLAFKAQFIIINKLLAVVKSAEILR
jgi:hypothetical protein